MRPIIAAFIAAVLLSSAIAPASADTLKLNANALFHRAITRNVQPQRSEDAQSPTTQPDTPAAGLVLERGVLYEDDGPAAGYTYQPNVEKLTEQVRIRKTLIIPSPAADHATLLVAPGGKLQCTINGKPVDLSKPQQSGSYWQSYDIDPAVLMPGRNELVLWGAGKLWIAREQDYAAGSTTRTHHPNRSTNPPTPAKPGTTTPSARTTTSTANTTSASSSISTNRKANSPRPSSISAT